MPGQADFSLQARLSGVAVTLTTPVIAAIYQDAAKTKLMTLPEADSDTLVVLTASQVLTNKTLTSPVIQGTVGAGTGLTMPAFTAGGDIAMAGNKLAFTDGKIATSGTSGTLNIRNAADNAYGKLRLLDAELYGDVKFQAPAKVIAAYGVDDSTVLFQAWDNDADALVEVAKLTSANDPFFSTGGAQDWKFLRSGGAICSSLGLPSSDPGVAGQLYYIAATGVVMRSAG